MSKGGESIFRGEGITVEDEFTNDTFDDEEEGGEGWLEDGDEVREDHLEIFNTYTIQVKAEEIEGLEEPYLLLLPPDPESDTEQPPPSRSLQNRVIHIQVELTAAVHCSGKAEPLYSLCSRQVQTLPSQQSLDCEVLVNNPSQIQGRSSKLSSYAQSLTASSGFPHR